MANESDAERAISTAWINGGFVVIAALIGGFFTWYGSRPHPTPPPLAADKQTYEPSVEQLLSESPITLNAWQSISSANYTSPAERKRVFQDFVGQQVTWEGYAKHWVELTDNATPAAAMMLLMYDSRLTLNAADAALAKRDRLPPPSVRCFLPEKARNELARVAPGKRVIVRGVLATPYLTGSALCTDLRHCEVLFVEGAERVAESTRAKTR